ncbi:MAG TPA: ADP-ribosylglycohydrolase family protein [Mesorhizobium sp.]|jgi:ADP-ribosylglycohydrolase|nr:ADP-ribosylglycohydrolase family protein [Mesorhizobium sp.]
MAALTDAERFDRALGALVGGALGDAMGMPTQTLSPAAIEAIWGRVEDFVPPPADHPVSAGLEAGAITDDTEQALLLARLLAEGRKPFGAEAWAAALLAWEADVRRRGLLDLLGPSTKRAVEAIGRGVPPDEAGRFGNTNGAAMRAGPMGILVPPVPLEALVDRVEETCRPTHNTGLAISGAAAVAAAVSAAVEGASWPEAAALAVEAAREGEKRGHWAAGARVGQRIAWALDFSRGRPRAQAIAAMRDLVGTSVAVQESVPAAFAVVEVAGGDPWDCAVIAANLGGDTDTIGAIAAGMAGALQGFSHLPQDKVRRLRGFDVPEARRLATSLLALREGRAAAADGRSAA